MPAIVRDRAGDIVVAGGLEHGQEMRALRTAERFDVGTASWQPLPYLEVSRCCCSAAVDVRGRIFVVGGGENMYSSSRAWDSVEWLDDLSPGAEPRWREGPAMNQARCALGVASSFETDQLFAAGGYGGNSLYLESAEVLDLSSGGSGRWLPLPNMSVKRAGANAAVGPDRRLYVLGGGPDGRDQHDTMEMLDPREPEWHVSRSRLNWGRHYNAAAFGPDGYLYVAGAFRHTGYLRVVERYDARVDKWDNTWEKLPEMEVPILFCSGAFIF
mmetsp:Transcript_159562/g.507953  ORF Transcript_159562/g.507953 Transcript_159562/m.507953 type:complete len:271 (+) Transcript_159562:303-1115(+)